MYELRALCAPKVAEELVALLRERKGVGQIVRHRSAETEADWDIVVAELPTAVVNSVLEDVAAIAGADDAQVMIAPADDRERYRFSDGRAVRVQDESTEGLGFSARSLAFQRLVRVDYQYIVLMAAAAIVATAGLIGDLPIAVVGAMAFSPDLSRLNAMAFAVIVGEMRLLARAAASLAIGLLVVIVASALGTLLLLFGDIEDPLTSMDERLVSFVTVLDGVTITVAVAAGVAAMVVFVADRGRAAVGVGVSVTTIPAAAYAGIAIADGSWASAGDALVVLGVNIFCVVAAGIVTGLAMRRHVERRARSLEYDETRRLADRRRGSATDAAMER